MANSSTVPWYCSTHSLAQRFLLKSWELLEGWWIRDLPWGDGVFVHSHFVRSLRRFLSCVKGRASLCWMHIERKLSCIQRVLRSDGRKRGKGKGWWSSCEWLVDLYQENKLVNQRKAIRKATKNWCWGWSFASKKVGICLSEEAAPFRIVNKSFESMTAPSNSP